MTTYALITAIEGDGNNLNEQLNIVKQRRLFEAEAIKCFTAWRENGGWLKDIPIYTICPTKNTISEETKKSLLKLNVTYIEEYMPITETFTSGFLNAPLIGMMMEERLTEDVLIKIDLDMNLIQPLPEGLVNSNIVICGQYDDYCTAQQRKTKDGWSNPYDTGFMITERNSRFYKFLFEMLMETMVGDDTDWADVKAVSGEYYLEEYVMDKIANTNLWPVTPIQRYQIGEWYTPVDEFSDDELKKVYFWHEHIIHDPHYDKMREKIAYFKRMKAIDDKQ
jgi:hypothetical protein